MSEEQNIHMRMEVDENTRIPLKFLGGVVGLVIVGVLWGARLEAKTYYSAEEIKKIQERKDNDSEKLTNILVSLAEIKTELKGLQKTQ